MRVALGALAWLLLPTNPAHTHYLANGSFQSDLAAWSTAQNSGAATFAVTPVDPKAGSTALRIVVADAGGSSGYPRLTYTASLPADAANTYTLSFFARCPGSTLDFRPAKLRIHLDGGGTAYACDYQPFKNWQEFHYSFKSSGAVRFSITFEAAGTYELNRLVLADQNEPTVGNQAVIDTPTSYLWQWGQQAYAQTHQDAVTGTDNDIAQQLPDGRVAWIFNDSNLGPLDFATNYRGVRSSQGSSMVRNCVVVQTGDRLTPLKPGKESFVPPDHHHLFWPTDAAIEGGKLKVLMEETNPVSLAGVDGWLASLTLPGLTEDAPFLVKVPWSGEILDGGDGYFYIYDDHLGPARKVARAPIGSLGEASAWTFYNGSTWVSDKLAATPLGGFASAPNAGASFERLGPDNFVATSYGSQGDTIGVHFAPTPVGPWTNYTSIYAVPHEDGQFYYDPHIYKHSGQNGTYTIGFSDYGWGWDPGKPFDKDYYFPQFIKTPNLLAMSPYTSGTFRDDFSSADLTDWQCYGGHWNKGSGVLAVDAADGTSDQAVAKGVVLSDLVFDVSVRSDTPGSSLGVIFRSSGQAVGTNAGQGYFAAITPGEGVTLSRVEGGRATRIAATAMSISAGVAYHLKVAATGSAITVFVTDMVNPIITAHDATYPSGGAGLRADNGSGCFDDVVITNRRYEAEKLTVAASSGATLSNFYEAGASAGSAVTFAATAVNDYVTFKLPGVSPGSYRVSLRVRQERSGGIGEFSVGESATTTTRALGAPVDTFQEGAQYREVNLGPLIVGGQQDEFFKLTVTGKNAASSGYGVVVDSIELIPTE